MYPTWYLKNCVLCYCSDGFIINLRGEQMLWWEHWGCSLNTSISRFFKFITIGILSWMVVLQAGPVCYPMFSSITGLLVPVASCVIPVVKINVFMYYQMLLEDKNSPSWEPLSYYWFIDIWALLCLSRTQPWVGHSTSLSLRYLICKIYIIIAIA